MNEFSGVDDDIFYRAGLAAKSAGTLGLQSAVIFPTTEGLRKQFAGEEHEPFYARHNHIEGIALEEIYSRFHNSQWAVATNLGESAIILLMRSLTKAGDGILSSENIFGTSKRNLERMASHDGRKLQFISIHSTIEEWQDRVEHFRPKVVFLESPSNPLADIVDIHELSNLLGRYEWNGDSGSYRPKLVVDATFLPPILQKPMKLGADYVVDSLSKFACGDNRVGGGIILGNEPKDRELIFTIRNECGANISQHSSLVLINNLKTLRRRVIAQSANALKVAEFLDTDNRVERVHYIGLPSHPQYTLSQSQLERDGQGRVVGNGSMLPFQIKGDLWTTKEVADATGFAIMASLGTIWTAISHPAGSTHYKLSAAERASAGIGDNLLRLSVGTEDIEQIIEGVRNGLSMVTHAK